MIRVKLKDRLARPPSTVRYNPILHATTQHKVHLRVVVDRQQKTLRTRPSAAARQSLSHHGMNLKTCQQQRVNRSLSGNTLQSNIMPDSPLPKQDDKCCIRRQGRSLELQRTSHWFPCCKGRRYLRLLDLYPHTRTLARIPTSILRHGG